MIPQMRTWADIKVGSYLRSNEGVDWKVVAGKPGFWGLIDRDGNEKILPAPPADAAVAVLILTPEELELALIETFGAEVYAVRRDGDNVYTVEPFGASGRVEDMKMHIRMMHGQWANEASFRKKSLIEMHDELHAEPELTKRWIPHVHRDLIPGTVNW